MSIQKEKAAKLVNAKLIKPVESNIPDEALNERMCIMGENCKPEQTEPYITETGVLVIPFNSDPKYHYWKKGG